MGVFREIHVVDGWVGGFDDEVAAFWAEGKWRWRVEWACDGGAHQGGYGEEEVHGRRSGR